VTKDIADAFRNNPNNTAKEFKVVRDSLAKSGTPEQVNNLTEGVRAELSPQDRNRFDHLISPGDEDRLIASEARPPITGPDKWGGRRKRVGFEGDNSKDARPSKGRFDDLYQRLETREGRKSTNDPTDRGGPTKLGVTKDTLADYHAWKSGSAGDIPTDVRDLKPEHAKKIYDEFYYKKYRIDEVKDSRMAEHLFDVNVHPGPGRAARWTQTEINRVAGKDFKVDGTIGSKTLETLNELSPEQRRRIANGIVETRERFYRAQVENTRKSKNILRAGSIERASSETEGKKLAQGKAP